MLPAETTMDQISETLSKLQVKLFSYKKCPDDGVSSEQ
ncbi:Uncharacterised protein [Chlamydia abortus]|nr:Uncharacterised protein [Chlamydia abortus]